VFTTWLRLHLLLGHKGYLRTGFPRPFFLCEVLHPVDLTCAMTSTNNWNSTYRNKFIKVTNRSNNQSIIVKVTDTAPANTGVELTYRAWVSIGKPSGSGTVKIELMGS
jgi:hypothetical protein